MQVEDIISQLKRFGVESLEPGIGVSGIDVEPAARALVNDLERYPHAFVLACIADRRTKSDIAWSLPLAIRKAAGGFDLDALLRLREDEWASVLASSGHPLATKMARLLPAALRQPSGTSGTGTTGTPRVSGPTGAAALPWPDGSWPSMVLARRSPTWP